MSKPFVVIENCEKEMSPWLFLEYRHSSMIYGRDYTIFTNIPVKYHSLLLRYGIVYEESIVNLVNKGLIKPIELIVLDPMAHEELAYEDLVNAKYVVIGGILGDHPPRGRTFSLITSKLPSEVRAFNIGNVQYSIDGAIYYVEYLLKNKNTIGLMYIDGVYIETDLGEIYLPYRYPVVNGKPLLADGLEYYLKHRRIRDDIWKEIVKS